MRQFLLSLWNATISCSKDAPLFINWIWHLNLPPTPTYSPVMWFESTEMINLSCLPPPQSISLTSPKPKKKYLKNSLLDFHEKQTKIESDLWKQGANMGVLGHIGQEGAEKVFRYGMFIDPSKKGQQILYHACACECQWGNGAICWLCSSGFAKNLTLLLFICNSILKVNQHFWTNRGCQKSNTCVSFAFLFGFYL